MAEADFYQDGNSLDYTPAAAVTAGDVLQLPDGRAAVAPTAIAAGVLGAVQVGGVYTVTAASTPVILDGAEVWWDSSAGEATYAPSNDLDFYLGTARGDKATSTTTMKVALNNKPRYIIDLHESGFDHAPVLTAGTPVAAMLGGSLRMAFSETAEAQKLDLLSKRSFPIAADWIAEFEVEVDANADADVADLNVGVANATHASDADSITESVFAHYDMGADLNLDAESDDGTTEVNATDTTVDWAVGTPNHIVMDGRDPTDIQIYVDGTLVLGATTFTLEDATGPLKLLLHLEKSANDSPGTVLVHRASVRIMD